MKDNEFLEKYFNKFPDIEENTLSINKYYFTGLLQDFRDNLVSDLKMWEPGASDSQENTCLPFALIPAREREFVTNYSDLDANTSALRSYELVLCKMHAGLGTSVKRSQHMKKYTERSTLGSKGTDLFMTINNESFSLAELQFIQMKKIASSQVYKAVRMLNMVNGETIKEVESIQENFSNELIDPSIVQMKVPTIGPLKELTAERVAPAGHGLVGFNLLLNIFQNTARNELITIGNGEDLNSTADEKILSWMVEKNIPIVMITTTKIECDKKGGQISRCQNGDQTFYTIVEKAQAEMAGQLEYFETLGLREGDHSALFNTNIAILNTKVLKERFELLGDMELEAFRNILTPTVIKNVKEQEGIQYTQLEGALGSVLLNLDKYFRLNHKTELIHFLNLNPIERGEFFIPIKTFQDFEDLNRDYRYNEKTGRFSRN